MSKWLPAVFSAIFAPLLMAQWTTAPASQSQYPDTSQNQSGSDSPDPADAQHGVARVSIVQGDVNVRRGDNGQLTGAVINAPLMAHDHLETSAGSRAEIQLDAATMLRLAPNSDLGFADLQYGRAQVQLGLGTIIFHVLPNATSQVEIDTPSIGIRATGPGDYRISVFDNGTSQVTVRSGQIELSGPRGSERLDAGRSVMIRGDASDPEMQTTAEIGLDDFDQWNQDRDRQFSSPQSQSARYVGADVQGSADLDQYGNWVSSGYGQVWRPQGVAADWSPYSNGQWSYVDYYGWSWIDYSPWGWAPYHYGRWFWNTGYGWCWWPGAHGYHSYWSPALVGFFGFGGRVGIGFGGLGWVALAPYEGLHRWWGRGGYGGYGGYGGGFRGGFSMAAYRNAGFRGGAMLAGANGFGGPHQRFVPATRSQMAGASSFSGRLPVTATQSSYNYSNRQAATNSRFAGIQSRGFYHQNVRQNGQSGARSFAGSSSPSANRGYPSTYSAAHPSGGNSNAGWQHFGTPSNGNNSYRQNFQRSESSGWHNFGQPQSGARSGGYQNSYQAPRYSAPSYQPRSNYSAPRQNYSAPSSRGSEQHYSAPSAPRGGGGGGGGSSHGGGGGGGHHGR